MPRSPYDLPPLSMLRAFEAAARVEAFNEAAAELNVTPGAISHQVKALEKELGIRLFNRGHRRVDLTEEGRALFAALQQGFAGIDRAVDALRRQGAGRRVEITATTAVSQLWLTPRLISFWAAHDEVQVSQTLSDRPQRRPLTGDLAIEYRVDRPPEPLHRQLFTDTLAPVAAPGFAAPATLGDLARLPLIHLDAPDENWTTWARWFRAQGFDGPLNLSRRVNNYTIATQLAAEGAGVALGWQRLISPLLRDGKLVVLPGFSIPAPGSFYLVATREDLSGDARLLFDWIGNSV